jgi:hypothetical protein
VRFDVFRGGGAVTDTVMTTGTDGTATAGPWRLSLNSTLNAVRVSGDSLSPIEFLVFANPGPPAALQLITGTGQVGFTNDAVRAPVVRVTDAYQNPVAGAFVDFAGTSGANPSNVVRVQSSASGSATPSSWILGPAAGTYSVTASAAGASSVVVTATAIDSASVTTVYDINSIDSRAPSFWGLDLATVFLASTGHFIEVDTWRNSAPAQSSGTYTIRDSTITFENYSGYKEMGTISQNSLTLRRPDYYYGYIQSWVFVKRTR